MKASYFSIELLPLLMSIPVKFLMAISGESVNEAMEAMLDTMERDLWAAKFDFRSMENSFSYQGLLVTCPYAPQVWAEEEEVAVVACPA